MAADHEDQRRAHVIGRDLKRIRSSISECGLQPPHTAQFMQHVKLGGIHYESRKYYSQVHLPEP
jgi:hypothetical protein